MGEEVELWSKLLKGELLSGVYVISGSIIVVGNWDARSL